MRSLGNIFNPPYELFELYVKTKMPAISSFSSVMGAEASYTRAPVIFEM